MNHTAHRIRLCYRSKYVNNSKAEISLLAILQITGGINHIIWANWYTKLRNCLAFIGDLTLNYAVYADLCVFFHRLLEINAAVLWFQEFWVEYICIELAMTTYYLTIKYELFNNSWTHLYHIYCFLNLVNIVRKTGSSFRKFLEFQAFSNSSRILVSNFVFYFLIRIFRGFKILKIAYHSQS